MKWILIYALMSAAGSVTSGSVEFNNEKACISAGDDMRDNFKSMAATICVPQGDEADQDTPKAPSAPSKATAPVAKK